MNRLSLSKIKYSKILLLILPICYLLLPNNNQTLDSWTYAYNVKFGEELFNAHHLLYNWFMYYLKLITKLYNINTMKFMQFINGVFSISSLLFLYLILLKIHNNKSKSITWTILVGCTFALLRYGTENETYILPIFFSIVASYFLILFFKRNSNFRLLIISGLFASISCLLHQVHFFWWLAILLGLFFFSAEKRIKRTTYFVLPALIVPITYIIVLCFCLEKELSINNILSFIFEYYYSENAETKFGSINFIMTPISFVRTFFQLHGNIITFVLAKPIISAFSIALSVYCFIKFLFPLKHLFNLNYDNIFINIHFLAFLLQFTFAFYSHGNAEFMVMLPFLMCICLSYWTSINNNKVLYLGLTMLTWNISFAILPNHFYNFQNNQELIKIIRMNPDKKFILEERNKIFAQYKYIYGEDISKRIFFKNEIILENQTGIFYTDILSKIIPFSRASIVLKNNNDFNFSLVREVEKIDCFYGSYSVDKINVK